MNPVEAFFQHAGEMPEAPWLFFRPRLDWRWRSYRHLAVQVTATAERLAALFPEGSPVVGFPRAISPDEAPDAVVMALAVLAIGGAAMPLQPLPGKADWDEALVAARCEAQILPVGKQRRASPRLPAVEVAPPPDPFSKETVSRISLERSVTARVVSAEGAQWPIERWTAEVEAAYAPLSQRTPERDVVVLAGDLRALESRRLLTWATLRGAALLLEPDRRAGAAAIEWARPTVIQATASELAGLRRLARPPGRWWKRRGAPFAPPFDRLRGLVVEGDEALPERAVNFWRRAGVEVLRLV